MISVHGRALEGNLEGDSPDRTVAVYLPPSYATNRKRRYPVVYLLHGYGRTARGWVSFVDLPASMDRDIAAGTAREMILVVPDANTRYGGSMYSDSPTIGDWETYITRDLVSYVDEHYRTIADRDSRGLGGHSMGGYGVWTIAMKHPEVYSSIYALSACCLMNEPHVRHQTSASARRAPPHSRGGHPINVPYGEAAAWSPDPLNPPLYFDQPIKDGKLRPRIAAKWVANSPLAMLDQYVSNMKSYRAIAMDVGLQDTLLRSNTEFHEALTRMGIQHSFETFQGNHTNHLEQRMEHKVFPFFSRHLSFRKESSSHSE